MQPLNMGSGELNLNLLEEQQVPLNHLYPFSFLIVQPGHTVVHAFNPSTWEIEAGGSMTLRPA